MKWLLWYFLGGILFAGCGVVLAMNDTYQQERTPEQLAILIYFTWTFLYLSISLLCKLFNALGITFVLLIPLHWPD